MPRIHAMISFSKRVTKNILSASFRCEIVKILHFALPFSSKSIFEISSLTPCVQPLKLGLAMSAFIFMASFRRSLLGQKVSTSKTPIFLNGGFAMKLMSSSMLTSFCSLNLLSNIVDISSCSFEFISSEPMPISDSTDAASEFI